MPRDKRFLLILLVLTMIFPAGAHSQPQATITVSGTVTGPSGVVSNVFVGVSSNQDQQTTTTNASGFYSVSVQTDGQLWFQVRPEESSRLAQVNLWIESVATSFTQDFTVVAGHLLDLQSTGTDGAPVIGDIWFDVQPLENALPGDRWYSLEWNDTSQRYHAVLPPDIYHITISHLPTGYYDTGQSLDLRSADRSVDLPLNTTYVHPIPYDPPDAAKITIGPPDALGEATVPGAAGAALPLAHVFLVNLNSTHQADAVSEADGSFSARIYAPPGSAIMVKHGQASSRWNNLSVGMSENVNPFPGTIINVPHTHTGDQFHVPFAAAGATDYFADDHEITLNYVSSAWAMTGTIGPVIVDGEWTRVLTDTYNGDVVPGLYLGGLNWTHPALSDLDDDDDLDLLVGERSGQLVLYRNLGSSESPDWQFETADYAGVNTGGWAYPALVDVTDDGAPDLFVGAGDGTVSIYYPSGLMPPMPHFLLATTQRRRWPISTTMETSTCWLGMRAARCITFATPARLPALPGA
jgi:hypothetical protein